VATGAAPPAANPSRHPAPSACPPHEPCLRIAVWPSGGGCGAMAQALLGLAAEPLDAVQQRKSGQRSGVLGRRPIEEKKNEKRNAGQQSEPFDCHFIPSIAIGDAAVDERLGLGRYHGTSIVTRPLINLGELVVRASCIATDGGRTVEAAAAGGRKGEHRVHATR